MRSDVVKKIFGDNKYVNKRLVESTFEHIYGVTIEEISQKLETFGTERLSEQEVQEFIEQYNTKNGLDKFSSGYKRLNGNDYKGYQEILDGYISRCQSCSTNLKKFINENEFSSVVKTDELCRLYTGLYLSYIKAGKAAAVANKKETYLRNFYAKYNFPKTLSSYTKYVLGFPVTNSMQYLTKFEKRIEDECIDIVKQTEHVAGERLVGLFS